MKNTSTTIFALLVGTALGVMIAPASGRETRRRIMEKGSGARDTLHYLVMEAGDVVDQLRKLTGNFDGSTNGQRSKVGSEEQERPR